MIGVIQTDGKSFSLEEEDYKRIMREIERNAIVGGPVGQIDPDVEKKAETRSKKRKAEREASNASAERVVDGGGEQ